MDCRVEKKLEKSKGSSREPRQETAKIIQVGSDGGLYQRGCGGSGGCG